MEMNTMLNKRILLAVVSLLCLCFACSALADTNAKEEQYQIGLTYLGYLTPEDVAESILYFENAGSFDQAKRFEIYAQALLEILQVDQDANNLNKAARRLERLDDEAFTAELDRCLLPQVADLLSYINARSLENEGRFVEAAAIYGEIFDTLDATDRQMNIEFSQSDVLYEQAMALYERGDHLAAAAIFRDLNWKDSAAMYRECIAHHAHEWIPATCETPRTCKWCGETSGSALGHNWTAATCTEPATCSSCGRTDGSALGHNWRAATCTEPKICTRCVKTEGSALGHSWRAATCTEPATCTRCGRTEGSALGHDWKAATYMEPQTCRRCGITSGVPLTSPRAETAPPSPATGVSLFVGQTVSFGHYEQDNNSRNGAESIQWYVLSVRQGKALLLSVYVLDSAPFQDNSITPRWQNCTLRDWLNNSFLYTAFSAAERNCLSNQTGELITLLSGDEYETLVNSAQAQGVSTAYARARGVHVDEGTGLSWWWTRSKADKDDYFLGVNSKCILTLFYMCKASGGVRPAVWINMDTMTR